MNGELSGDINPDRAFAEESAELHKMLVRFAEEYNPELPLTQYSMRMLIVGAVSEALLRDREGQFRPDTQPDIAPTSQAQLVVEAKVDFLNATVQKYLEDAGKSINLHFDRKRWWNYLLQYIFADNVFLENMPPELSKLMESWPKSGRRGSDEVA